jgi:hypothetical protein
MTSKREMYRAALRPLLLAALDSPGLLSPAEFNMARFSLNAKLRAHLLDPDIAALEDYLIDHSNLPGPRANLELVWAFADEVAALCAAPDVSLNRSYVALEWLLWQLHHRYPADLYGSDPDSPLQMPQLCGAVARGEWAAAFRHIELGVSTLLEMADSPLWRVKPSSWDCSGCWRVNGTARCAACAVRPWTRRLTAGARWWPGSPSRTC